MQSRQFWKHIPSCYTLHAAITSAISNQQFSNQQSAIQQSAIIFLHHQRSNHLHNQQFRNSEIQQSAISNQQSAISNQQCIAGPCQ
jgi:hypothetical protein